MAPALIRRCELPAEVTGFVGRRSELADLTSTLRDARIVTVTGPAGVGKTRLALRAAASVAPGYADGVCLVELSALRDPELLAHTVAASLALPEQDDRSQLDAVLGYLRDRRTLLILDTCEHLLAACALFAETACARAPGLTILATSRQPLDAPGEHAYLVAPLPVTGANGETAGDAVELFVQRASAAAGGFVLSESNLRDTIALCRRLDGIPLAIELAAVRLRVLSLPVLVERLKHRFEILSGGRRSSVPRHQTLRTAIDWSHDLCSRPERDLWARLSVFAGSFDIAAAGEVCADKPGADEPGTDGELRHAGILPALTALVDKSIVIRSTSDDGGTRYRMLDTLREFGAERLAERPDVRAAIRGRHVARYLAAATGFEQHIVVDQLARLHALRREHADIRAALEYALELDETGRDAARIAARLDYYWHMSGLLSESAYWLTKILECPVPAPERAWAFVARAHAEAFQGMTAAARADAAEGIAIAKRADESLAVARGYLQLHLTLSHSGEMDAAAAASAVAAERMRGLGDTFGLLLNDVTTAYRHLQAGQFDRVVSTCFPALNRVPAGGTESYGTGYLNMFGGLALFLRGETDAGFTAVCAGLRAKHALGETVGTAYCLEFLSWMAVRQNRYPRAAWLLGAADALWRLAGSRVSGNPVMEEAHRRTEQAVIQALGEHKYAALATQGRELPLDRAVECALAGNDGIGKMTANGLTAREREIAALVAEGLSNREIANKLVISKRTVDSHIEHIFAKLGVNSRARIAARLRDG